MEREVRLAQAARLMPSSWSGLTRPSMPEQFVTREAAPTGRLFSTVMCGRSVQAWIPGSAPPLRSGYALE